MSTIYRDANHTDHEHEAREHGFNRGYDHANYVDTYGWTQEPKLPERFADVADVWRNAYQEGKEDFAATQEEEDIYGHDWKG